MRYPTILVHVDLSVHAPARVRYAGALARFESIATDLDDSGQRLLALANELGCGMLVMGCYGHSRFRELCLGGASRTVPAQADIPLMLAH